MVNGRWITGNYRGNVWGAWAEQSKFSTNPINVQQVFGDWAFVSLSIMALLLRLPTICFPQRLSPNSTTRMALNSPNISRVSFPDYSTKKSDELTNRKLPILLFDIMDTIVRDPFYHDVPTFFRYQNFYLLSSFLIKFWKFPSKFLSNFLSAPIDSL